MTKADFKAKFGKTIPDEFCYIFQPNLLGEKHGLMIIGAKQSTEILAVDLMISEKELTYDSNFFFRCCIEPAVTVLSHRLSA